MPPEVKAVNLCRIYVYNGGISNKKQIMHRAKAVQTVLQDLKIIQVYTKKKVHILIQKQETVAEDIMRMVLMLIVTDIIILWIWQTGI